MRAALPASEQGLSSKATVGSGVRDTCGPRFGIWHLYEVVYNGDEKDFPRLLQVPP